MASTTIVIFLMMLITALLGFTIAWVWNERKSADILREQKDLKKKHTELQDEYKHVIRHSNKLQAEHSHLLAAKDRNQRKYQSQKEIIQQLEQEKDFLFQEYEAFRKEAKEKILENQKVIGAFEELKDKSQKTKLKADKWKVRFHELQAELKTAEINLRKITRENHKLSSQLEHADDNKAVLEWESNYKELKLRFLALAKEKKDLEEAASKANVLQKNVNEDWQKELQKLRKENQQLNDELLKQQQNNQNNGNAIFQRIKNRARGLDFSRIGKANPRKKDNLKLLKRVGPSMEKRFHSIGNLPFPSISRPLCRRRGITQFFTGTTERKVSKSRLG